MLVKFHGKVKSGHEDTEFFILTELYKSVEVNFELLRGFGRAQNTFWIVLGSPSRRAPQEIFEKWYSRKSVPDLEVMAFESCATSGEKIKFPSNTPISVV